MTKPKTVLVEQRLLTVSEAGKVLGYKSVNPVYKLIADGLLKTTTLPGRGGTRIDTEDLDAFIASRKGAA